MPDFAIKIDSVKIELTVLSTAADIFIVQNTPPVVAMLQPRFPEVVSLPVDSCEKFLQAIQMSGLTFQQADDMPGEFAGVS